MSPPPSTLRSRIVTRRRVENTELRNQRSIRFVSRTYQISLTWVSRLIMNTASPTHTTAARLITRK